MEMKGLDKFTGINKLTGNGLFQYILMVRL